MAEINQPNRQPKKGRSFFAMKKINIDLTPMVDLGFILVTFFVFTSTLSELKVMNMVTPNDENDGADKICASCALTFIPVQGDNVWYYSGMEQNANYQLTTISQLRNIISQKKKWVQSIRGKDELQVIIRGAEGASFSNVVDIIDECHIAAVKSAI